MILRLSASIALLTFFPIHAQQTASTRRSTAVSDASMRSLLQGMGVNFTETSGDTPAFAFLLNAHTVTLLNLVKSMQLSACVADDFDPLQANRWNQDHFFTGVRLDPNGCAALRSDVGFAGGVTNEMIEAFIRQFCTNVTIFAKFMSNVQPGSGTPDAPDGIGTQPADRSPSPIGTMAWSQLGQLTKRLTPWTDATSAPGLLKINGNISLKYDPDLWTPVASDNDREFVLLHSSGDAHALVIAEPIAVPLDSIQDVALANAQAVDPNAKIVFRNKLRVNGAVLYFLKIEANVDTVPMVYWGYFYAGENGTVQVVTYTAKTLWPGHEREFMDFLNGFVVSK
jgi:Putative bacterial sensory transduction regulator